MRYLMLLLLGGAALLADYRTERYKTFDEIDRNGNGVIDGFEWNYLPSFFHWLDHDGDSALSADEFNFGSNAEFRRMERMHLWDRDRDRTITRQEWRGAVREFTDLDANDDDMLEVSEYMVAQARSARPFRSAPQRDERSADPYDMRIRRDDPAFRRLDRDRDGFIYGDEWPGDMDLYYRLDRDNDGVLSRREFLGRG